MQLTDTAKKIITMKYSLNQKETWEEVCLRVAEHIISAEDSFHTTTEEKNYLKNKFFSMIYNQQFIPGGRILANAGTDIKNLMNCFSLPIEDSRSSIYQALKDAAEIFAWGGGCGYNFSHVREEGAEIKTTGGKASGPLSFLTLFDQTGEVIQQASRRGAQIGLLSVEHPDIEKFIDFKAEPNSRNKRLLEEYHRNLKYVNGTLKNTKYYDVLKRTLLEDQLTHFNLSVILTDDFFHSIESDLDWIFNSVIDETKEHHRINAKKLLEKIAKQAWDSGDPGLFFIDRINEDNMVPYIGKLEVCNPCGEVPLLPYESCCLGSINLVAFYDEERNTLDWELLENVARNAVRFLDNVQEISETPVEQINKMSKGLRRIGIGVMGWADLLALLEMPYNSEEAYKLANYISWFISFFSWMESIDLVKTRGKFKFYDKDQVNFNVVDKILISPFVPYDFNLKDIIENGVRNVSVTSIAPTGSIALLCGVNSSIEPFFALAYKRNITEGVGNIAKDSIIEVNSILLDKLKKYGYEDRIDEIKEHIQKTGTIQDLDFLNKKLRLSFLTSRDLLWFEHIHMQASWQEYVTNAVSKTINLPNDATVDNVYRAFMMAWGDSLKGITVYRDGSRQFQILNVG